jgi:hypothetical protein
MGLTSLVPSCNSGHRIDLRILCVATIDKYACKINAYAYIFHLACCIIYVLVKSLRQTITRGGKRIQASAVA